MVLVASDGRQAYPSLLLNLAPPSNVGFRPPATPGKRGNPLNWQRWSGWPGSIIID